jgi:hypothetical protein
LNVVSKKNPETIADRLFRIERRSFPLRIRVYQEIHKKGTDTMVPITEDEKKGSLYKYFIRDMVEPDPSKYAQTRDAIDLPEEESALHLDILFNPGYMPVELGYGYLPDGCAILANLTDFPGVTVDMFDFWFAWHPIESMRYKIRNRDQHYYCQTMNPEIALNKSLSLRERLWNTPHDIEEDCNMGKQPIKIRFCNPADIGFTWSTSSVRPPTAASSAPVSSSATSARTARWSRLCPTA